MEGDYFNRLLKRFPENKAVLELVSKFTERKGEKLF
jgi:hypothetical protein